MNQVNKDKERKGAYITKVNIYVMNVVMNVYVIQISTQGEIS